MKTQNQLCLLCIILTCVFISCDCGRDPIDPTNDSTHIDLPTFMQLGERIVIDSTLRSNSSYYKVYTFMCNSDTIFQYKYTNLLAPNQPIKAQFIPGTAFSQFSSELKDSFAISPSVLNWVNLREYTEVSHMPTSGNLYYSGFVISVASTYQGSKRNWILADTTDAPGKIYYTYNWESKVHHDYMRYNADSAIITLTISNIEAANITPIDSVNVLFPNLNIAKTYSQFPVEIKDTIGIVEDTTYNYLLKGFLKGQASGQYVHVIRVHKNEIISDQNQTHLYQGSVYEYDYEE